MGLNNVLPMFGPHGCFQGAGGGLGVGGVSIKILQRFFKKNSPRAEMTTDTSFPPFYIITGFHLHPSIPPLPVLLPVNVVWFRGVDNTGAQSTAVTIVWVYSKAFITYKCRKRLVSIMKLRISLKKLTNGPNDTVMTSDD